MKRRPLLLLPGGWDGEALPVHRDGWIILMATDAVGAGLTWPPRPSVGGKKRKTEERGLEDWLWLMIANWGWVWGRFTSLCAVFSFFAALVLDNILFRHILYILKFTPFTYTAQ